MSVSFEPGEELAQVVDAVRAFARERLRPALRELEAAGALSEELARECHELGLATLGLPETLGGSELLDLRAAALCAEELAWGDLGAAVALPGPGAAAPLVLALGTGAQAERLLAPFADEAEGWARRAALALVEGPFGVDPAACEATCRREGEEWVLSGRKRYVRGGADAALTLVLARDVASGAPDPWDRLALLAVVGRPAGLAVEARHETLGLGAARWADLRFEQVRVPAADRLGGDAAPGALRRVLRDALARQRTLDAARLVGCARAATEHACDYAQERHAFGVPLYQHQALAFMMADMATRVDGVRSLVWQAAAALDRGDARAPALALLAHRQTAELAVEVCSDAVQVLGGHGYLWDHPVEKWMRDARTLSLVDGLTLPEDEAEDELAGLELAEG